MGGDFDGLTNAELLIVLDALRECACDSDAQGLDVHGIEAIIKKLNDEFDKRARATAKGLVEKLIGLYRDSLSGAAKDEVAKGFFRRARDILMFRK